MMTHFSASFASCKMTRQVKTIASIWKIKLYDYLMFVSAQVKLAFGTTKPHFQHVVTKRNPLKLFFLCRYYMFVNDFMACDDASIKKRLKEKLLAIYIHGNFQPNERTNNPHHSIAPCNVHEIFHD